MRKKVRELTAARQLALTRQSKFRNWLRSFEGRPKGSRTQQLLARKQLLSFAKESIVTKRVPYGESVWREVDRVSLGIGHFALNVAGASAVELLVDRRPLPTPDFDGNGSVDAADYVLWRGTLGSSSDLRADANADGIIGPADYDAWRAHFGQTTGSGAGASANAVVPEPATLVPLILAAAGWSLRRGRAA